MLERVERAHAVLAVLVVVGLVPRTGVRGGVLGEGLVAVLGAEVVGGSLVLGGGDGPGWVDAHPADGVGDGAGHRVLLLGGVGGGGFHHRLGCRDGDVLVQGGGGEAAQPVGVGDHGQRGQCHRRGGDHRTEPQSQGGVEHAGGDRDAHDVVEECERQVLADVAHGGPGQVDRGDQPGRCPGDQRDVGGLDGHVGTGSDGQPHIGLGQGGGIVDPVADHADRAALGLQPADLIRLVLRQDLGQDAADADLAGDRRCRETVVAGDHDDLDATGL